MSVNLTLGADGPIIGSNRDFRGFQDTRVGMAYIPIRALRPHQAFVRQSSGKVRLTIATRN